VVDDRKGHGLSLPRGGAGKGQLRVDSRNQSALAKGRFRSERLGVGGFLIVPDRALLPARRNVFWAAKFEVGGADPEKRQKTSILGLKRGSKWLVLTPFSVVLAPALGRFGAHNGPQQPSSAAPDIKGSTCSDRGTALSDRRKPSAGGISGEVDLASALAVLERASRDRLGADAMQPQAG
jgi:hypothetical protein